ncbi:hypothetical protein H8356DRAFT_1318350 [Neocallimastix lanati (nom. inval.)]|uniref:Uncharacterized protein n=1 Tax=Neocallimastix californiae TaxID=1754190 RepID=A0A1Y2CGD8_9FUNG|nr:hypothetical protein H8356DRAFT_1318350 [Neocallimastix sp. JGI-2020a]ORY45385.1 hypothetical protein LY90DRAFT_671510 [Neocallimastix californiae]|eukprot:ORY45385.1 hypothetical protein LY90DRAFT_671510 [Neocallimastix californiae]
MKNYMENTRTLLSERSDVMEDLILIEENCAQALRFLKPLINDLLKYQEKIDRNYKLKNRLMNHINRNFN